MKKTLLMALLVFLISGALSVCFAGETKQGPRGPAPDSGDGIPDGPGWEDDW